MMMRSGLVTVFFVLTLRLFGQQTHVYVSAHPDDWQLFMNPNVYKSVADSTVRVMILHTTAGDAGAGKGGREYYLAREEGSKRAIRFMVNAAWPQTRLGTDMSESLEVINGHYIARFGYGPVVTYFLRLPDGNHDGSGYDIHQKKSLLKFYAGEVSVIQAVDENTIYENKEDLIKTVTEIIKSEIEEGEKVQINAADTDASINPNDHSDHLTTSYLMQDVARQLGLEFIRLYVDYSTNQRKPNVSEKDLAMVYGTWGATASGLSDAGHYSTWDRWHNEWLTRLYFREVSLEELKKK